MKAVATDASYAEGIGNLIEQASGLLIEYARWKRIVKASSLLLQHTCAVMRPQHFSAKAHEAEQVVVRHLVQDCLPVVIPPGRAARLARNWPMSSRRSRHDLCSL
jgi:hypothetical protein